MSKKIVCCSFYVLGMVCLIVQVVELFILLDKLEGWFDIIVWLGYIECGQIDKQYDWVSQFEKDIGCQVNVKIVVIFDEMVSLMVKGGYDLVIVLGDVLLCLIMGKCVQLINMVLIVGWGFFDLCIVKGVWFNVGGKVYGMLYQWGLNLLMYNICVFLMLLDSWCVVFVKQDLLDGKINQGWV